MALRARKVSGAFEKQGPDLDWQGYFKDQTLKRKSLVSLMFARGQLLFVGKDSITTYLALSIK